VRKIAGVLLVMMFPVTSFASQPLETETARTLPKGVVKLEFTAEFQTGRDGRERAFPFVFEYGFTDTTELAIEPVFATSIRPKSGARASGFGDVEVTLTHRLFAETAQRPAFAVAGEVKLPTARNVAIGTGKADFAAYAIASKRISRTDVHLNLGYTVVGRPAGTHAGNVINFAVAGEFHVSPRLDVVSEIVGNTSSTGDKVESVTAPVTTELRTAESSILIGARYFIRPTAFFAIGLAYDNNHALLVRPGFTFRF
jgi:hypothetical protein